MRRGFLFNAYVSEQGEYVVSSKDSSVIIQTSSQSVPSTPSWFGEVTVIAHYLEHLGVLRED